MKLLGQLRNWGRNAWRYGILTSDEAEAMSLLSDSASVTLRELGEETNRIINLVTDNTEGAAASLTAINAFITNAMVEPVKGFSQTDIGNIEKQLALILGNVRSADEMLKNVKRNYADAMRKITAIPERDSSATSESTLTSDEKAQLTQRVKLALQQAEAANKALHKIAKVAHASKYVVDTIQSRRTVADAEAEIESKSPRILSTINDAASSASEIRAQQDALAVAKVQIKTIEAENSSARDRVASAAELEKESRAVVIPKLADGPRTAITLASGGVAYNTPELIAFDQEGIAKTTQEIVHTLNQHLRDLAQQIHNILSTSGATVANYESHLGIIPESKPVGMDTRYALPFFNHENPLWGWGWGAPDITTEMFSSLKGLGTLLGHMLFNYPIRVGLRYYAGMMVGIGAAMPVINLEDNDPQNPSFAAHAAREFNTAAFALEPLVEAIHRANAEGLPWTEATKNALSAMTADPRGITFLAGIGAGLFLFVLDKISTSVQREEARYNQDAPHRLLKFFVSTVVYAGVEIAMSSLIAKGIIPVSSVNNIGPLTLALVTAVVTAPLVTAIGKTTVDVAVALSKGQCLPTRTSIDLEMQEAPQATPGCGTIPRPAYRASAAIS